MLLFLTDFLPPDHDQIHGFVSIIVNHDGDEITCGAEVHATDPTVISMTAYMDRQQHTFPRPQYSVIAAVFAAAPAPKDTLLIDLDAASRLPLLTQNIFVTLRLDIAARILHAIANAKLLNS